MTWKEKADDYMKDYRQRYKDKMKRVSTTLSHEEYARLMQLSKKNNIKPTAFLKQLFLCYANDTPLLDEEVSSALRDLNRYLSTIANNINQIAHHSNIVKQVVDENELFVEIKKMQEGVKSFINQAYKSRDHDTEK